MQLGLIPAGRYILAFVACFARPKQACTVVLWAEERDRRFKNFNAHLPSKDDCANLVQNVINCALMSGGLWHSSKPTLLEAHHAGQTSRFCGVDMERLDDGGLQLHHKLYVLDLLAT